MPARPPPQSRCDWRTGAVAVFRRRHLECLRTLVVKRARQAAHRNRHLLRAREFVESKSFKLYLGSFSSTQVASVDALCDTLKRDVSACAGATVSVQLTPPVGFGQLMLGELGGVSLDRLDLDIEIDEPDASLLSADAKQAPIDETVVSNLLK